MDEVHGSAVFSDDSSDSAWRGSVYAVEQAEPTGGRMSPLKRFFSRVANLVVWIMAGMSSVLMVIGAVSIIVVDIYFTAQVLGAGFTQSLHLPFGFSIGVGLLFSLAISGMLVGTQVLIGFGDDANLGTAWRKAGRWQRTAFGLSFIVRAIDAWLATYFVDLYMVSLPNPSIDGMVYWLVKALVFTIDFAGELIAPAALIVLSRWDE